MYYLFFFVQFRKSTANSTVHFFTYLKPFQCFLISCGDCKFFLFNFVLFLSLWNKARIHTNWTNSLRSYYEGKVRKITQSKTKTLLNELNVSHSSQGSTLWPVGSPMRPAFTQWRPNFHAWSPNSTDAKLVQWMHQLRWGYVTARTRQQGKDFCFSLWHFCHVVQSKFSGLKKLDSRSF